MIAPWAEEGGQEDTDKIAKLCEAADASTLHKEL